MTEITISNAITDTSVSGAGGGGGVSGAGGVGDGQTESIAQQFLA